MARQLIKVAKDVDLYMEWSSIVEAPICVGTREEMKKLLAEPILTMATVRHEDHIERMLATADEFGSSPSHNLACPWDSSGEIYEQRGWLPRTNFTAFARLHVEAGDKEFTDEQWDRLMALLEPFDDESSVRTKR